jgi:hypothetical protein
MMSIVLTALVCCEDVAKADADLTLSYADERWRARETRDPLTLGWFGRAWR